jgi:hypothetical protein
MKTFIELKAFIEGLPATTSALLEYNGQAFYQWQSERLGNDLFLSDPERADRIQDAAEHGADGSTHREHIQDFREYAEELFDEASRELWRGELTDAEGDALEAALDAKRDAFAASADALEAWHRNNGSLDEEIG